MDAVQFEKTFGLIMKILMGIPAPWLKGGPPTHLPLLVDYFEKDGNYQIKTFYFGSEKQEGNENAVAKIFHTLKVLVRFIRLIIGFRPQIIHLNSAFDKNSLLRDIPFSLVSKLTHTPLIFKIHGSHYELLHTKNPILIFLVRIYFGGASKVGVLSEFEKNEFIQSFGNASKLIVVKNIVRQIENGISDNKQVTKTKNFDVLFVSRIEKGKGLEDLLQAIPIVIKSHPSFVVAIAGTGRALNEYKKMATDLNISSSVKWLGHIPNEKLENVFHQSKIFIFTSHFPEGMPMAMVEALLYGMPVITTKTRFAVSYLKEEKNVLFIDRHQPQQIAEKIFYLLDNAMMQAKMKKENILFIREFSQKKVGNEFSDVYSQMVCSQ